MVLLVTAQPATLPALCRGSRSKPCWIDLGLTATIPSLEPHFALVGTALLAVRKRQFGRTCAFLGPADI
jgi:hypothetical protein